MKADIQNLTLQPTAVVEAELAPLPELPETLLRISGVSDWWRQMKLTRERDKETLYRLTLTRSGVADGGGSGLSRITAVGRSAIVTNSTTTVITSPVTTATTFDNDSLLLAWIGL